MASLNGFMIWVEDVAASVAFYKQAFELTATQVDLENGFALIAAGGVDLQFADERAAGRTGVAFRPNRPTSEAAACQLALVADDVEAAYEKAVAAGADPVVPVTAMPWGQRVGYLRDLNGFLVEMASPASW